MLKIRKTPTLAVMGRGEGSAGASKGEWENSTRSSLAWEGFTSAKRGGLTHGWCWGMVKAPKIVRGVAIAVSSSPTMKKVLPAYSACLAAGVFIGRLVHIGGIITSGTREGPAVSDRLGSVVIPPLFLIPNCQRFPHA